MIFFVAPDGSISTSDSFKGEDDIIYGFSEEGISQYLEKTSKKIILEEEHEKERE